MASKATVRRRLEALRAAGHPTSMAELAERCRLPETTPNAADVYVRAFAAYEAPPEGTEVQLLARIDLPARGSPTSGAI